MCGNSWTLLQHTSFCHLLVRGQKDPTIVTAKTVSTNVRRFRPIVNGQKCNDGLMSSYVPKHLQYKIFHVSFNVKNDGVMLQPYLKITYVDKQDNFTHTFGQCNANGIAFGYMGDKEARWFVEWIEMNMLFGISEFNFYNGTMKVSNKYQQVLDYYKSKGILRIYHQFPPSDIIDPTKNQTSDLAKRTSYNDCLYRNMYRYKYIFSVDLDEIIVPQGTYSNYYEIAKQLNLSNTGSVAFQAEAFFQRINNQPQNVSSEWDLISSKFIKSVRDARRKHFFNPRLCIAGFSHRCMITLRGAPNIAPGTTQKLGKTHHYRHECLKEEGDEKICHHKLKLRQQNTNIQRFVTEDFYSKVLSIWNMLNL